jgi:hypothetical protein
VADRVEQQIIGARCRAVLRATQRRPQPGEQFGEHERLHQVVVTTRSESRQPVGDVVARGEEEHRCLEPARTQHLTDVAAVRIRQPDVEDDRIQVRERHPQCPCAVRSRDDGVVLGTQPARQHVAQCVIVLHHEDASVHRRSIRVSALRRRADTSNDQVGFRAAGKTGPS